jgi:pilus assembly protein Flp/PilA
MNALSAATLWLSVWLDQARRDVQGAARRVVVYERGQGMVEYGLILALVAIGVIAVLVVLGTQARGIFDDAAKGLQGARITPTP